MNGEQEIRRWIKVARPANGSLPTVTVTLVQGNLSAKHSLKTSLGSLQQDTKACYRHVQQMLDDIRAVDALLDEIDEDEEAA